MADKLILGAEALLTTGARITPAAALAAQALQQQQPDNPDVHIHGIGQQQEEQKQSSYVPEMQRLQINEQQITSDIDEFFNEAGVDISQEDVTISRSDLDRVNNQIFLANQQSILEQGISRVFEQDLNNVTLELRQQLLTQSQQTTSTISRLQRQSIRDQQNLQSIQQQLEWARNQQPVRPISSLGIQSVPHDDIPIKQKERQSKGTQIGESSNQQKKFIAEQRDIIDALLKENEYITAKSEQDIIELNKQMDNQSKKSGESYDKLKAELQQAHDKLSEVQKEIQRLHTIEQQLIQSPIRQQEELKEEFKEDYVAAVQFLTRLRKAISLLKNSKQFKSPISKFILDVVDFLLSILNNKKNYKHIKSILVYIKAIILSLKTYIYVTGSKLDDIKKSIQSNIQKIKDKFKSDTRAGYKRINGILYQDIRVEEEEDKEDDMSFSISPEGQVVWVEYQPLDDGSQYTEMQEIPIQQQQTTNAQQQPNIRQRIQELASRFQLPQLIRQRNDMFEPLIGDDDQHERQRLGFLVKLQEMAAKNKKLALLVIPPIILWLAYIFTEWVWSKPTATTDTSKNEPLIKKNNSLYSFDPETHPPSHCRREIYRDQYGIFRSIVTCEVGTKKTIYYDK